jgi:hypothetical protein
MSRTTRRFSLASAFALGLALVGIFSAASKAASINYGDFGPVPPGVSFLQVTESSGTDPVPLYGPPTPFSVGLDFDPLAFVASTAGGGADITDGQLNFTVSAAQGLGISGLNLNERGDYTLVGVGTNATSVFAGAVILASVTQINGVNVAPIPLPASNASVGFNLVANPGIVQPWSLGTGLVVPAALGLVTKLDVSINNSLVAFSEPGSIAFIAKKDFVIRVDTKVPEPATMALAGLALCGLGFARRSRA